MRKNALILACTFWVLFSPLLADNDREFSLQELIDIGLENSPLIGLFSVPGEAEEAQ